MLPQTPSFRLDGRRALVVGATSGIGLGCAAALSQAGASVTIAARRLDSLLETKKCFQAAGYDVETMELDVGNVSMTANAIFESPAFDVLVNSAGIARHTEAFSTTEDDFDAVSNANFKGAYFLSQSVAKQMRSSNIPGSIINISSQMGHVGGIDRAVYCATKHAVEGFTKSMAIEWGKFGIRINTICPTFVKTKLTEVTLIDPAKLRWIEEKIKLNRLGEIEDIMGATVFFASDASSLVTGTSLLIDGGWTAG